MGAGGAVLGRQSESIVSGDKPPAREYIDVRVKRGTTTTCSAIMWRRVIAVLIRKCSRNTQTRRQQRQTGVNLAAATGWNVGGRRQGEVRTENSLPEQARRLG